MLNTFIVPAHPRDVVPLDVLRYDTCKLNICHRYELLAVGVLAGKREYDVTVIIGLPRAGQTTSIPHQIHKRFPHVSTPHPHFARKQPCQTFTRCKTPRVSVWAKITGTSFVRPSRTFHFLGPIRKSPAPRLARSESVTIYEEPQQDSTSALYFSQPDTLGRVVGCP